jgi:hypothetical protein
MGLPARFTVGVQNQVEHFSGDTFERSFTLEACYAPANCNKLPLNPTISIEYHFGLDNAVQDSGEFTLLISHDFPHLVEWAMNIFVDREFGGEESTSADFAQSVEVPVLLPEEKLEVGLEMQYRSGGETIRPDRTIKGLVLGPTLAWRPTKSVRFEPLSSFRLQSSHAGAANVRCVLFVLWRTNGKGNRNTGFSAWPLTN